MVDVPDCCYCGAPWTLGGYAHSRTCFITTGHLTLEAGRRAKRNRTELENRPVQKPALELDDE